MIETSTLQCPKCGKPSFVKRRDDLYQCLACDHKKDLDAAEPESSGSSILAVIVLAIVMLLVVVQMRSTESCPAGDILCFEQLRR